MKSPRTTTFIQWEPPNRPAKLAQRFLSRVVRRIDEMEPCPREVRIYWCPLDARHQLLLSVERLK